MKKSILIIDDDKLVLKTLRQLLDKLGYSVVSAANGEEAYEAVLERDFDLVISDIRMPGEDGLALIKRIKDYWKSKSCPEVPFIFITGYASEEAPVEAIKLGAKDYVLKPFDLQELVNSVKKNLA